MNRPKVDESLCFICQVRVPTKMVTRTNETFNVCSECAEMVTSELRIRNKITKSLCNNEIGDKIFTMTLGMKPTAQKVTISDL